MSGSVNTWKLDRDIAWPNTRHPYYNQDRFNWIEDWLDGKMPSWNQQAIRVPVPRSMRFNKLMLESSEALEPMSFPEFLIQRSWLWWPAPFIGDPFFYVWPVGTDQFKRHFAGSVFTSPGVCPQMNAWPR